MGQKYPSAMKLNYIKTKIYVRTTNNLHIGLVSHAICKAPGLHLSKLWPLLAKKIV